MPFYSDSDLARKFFDSIDSTLPFSMEYDDKVQFKEYWTSALKKYYLNDLTASKDVLLRNLTHIVGDIVITCPMHTALQQHLAVAKRPQYLYRFEYEGTFKFSYLYAGHRVNNYGVAHGDELLYLFPARSSYFGPPEYKKNENDWKMVDMMVELWTSFATTGTPSASMFNGTKIWEPFSSRNNYLQIGNGGQLTLENKSGFLTARMQFCKELYANTTWV
ncbi:carboxylesterase 4A-like [Diprion similis]|uniref:carboxylesterase 4A-like n=1 Tax=Diprion similis TaxID=362088 RepID=UPI001EF77F72|nr:carboxylesterase 4A-like [Diprion similis]